MRSRRFAATGRHGPVAQIFAVLSLVLIASGCVALERAEERGRNMSPQECRLECLRDEVICKDSMVWRRWPDPEIWCHDRRVQCEEECGQGTGEEKGPPPAR